MSCRNLRPPSTPYCSNRVSYSTLFMDNSVPIALGVTALLETRLHAAGATPPSHSIDALHCFSSLVHLANHQRGAIIVRSKNRCPFLRQADLSEKLSDQDGVLRTCHAPIDSSLRSHSTTGGEPVRAWNGACSRPLAPLSVAK